MGLFVSTTLVYLIYCASYASAVRSTVPVFMIDYDQIMSHIHIDPNPFVKMSQAKFQEIINDSADRATGIVIFVEENFSVEDISVKDVLYGTPYQNLHAALEANRDTVKYFPSVIDPYSVLLRNLPKFPGNFHYLAQNSKLRLKDNFRHLYIYFTDSDNESKTDILKRHDTVIREILGVARRLKTGPVVAFYTGKVNPVVVDKVEYVKDLPNDMKGKTGILLSSPWALVRISGTDVGKKTRRTLQSGTPTLVSEYKDKQIQRSKFEVNEFELEWCFGFEKGFWKINAIILYEGHEEMGRVNLAVRVPYNFSYYCDEPLVIVNSRDNSMVYLTEVLVEPKKSLEVTKFNPSIHCTPYFNTTAWSTIFISFILLGIIFFGIIMIWDVKTNDRYEDPDGKPLVHETLH